MPPGPDPPPRDADQWTPVELIGRPELHPARGPRERHASWLELFYDLVFVSAVGATSHALGEHLSWNGLLRFVALFVPVWWAWVGHTVYASRFATDDVTDRLLTLGLMLGAAGMAVQIPFVGGSTIAFHHESDGFALSFVLARVMLLLLYLRAHAYVADARHVTRFHIVGIGAGALLWTLSVLTPPPIRYALWAVGLLVDVAVPWWARGVMRQAPVDVSHMPERFGLFTIIVLGESIVAITAGVTSVRWNPLSVTAAVLVFAVIAAIWWLYFTFLRVAPVGRSLGSGQPYAYAHLPLVLSLAALGAGLLHVIPGVAEGPGSLAPLYLVGGSLTAWMIAFLVVQVVAIRNDDDSPLAKAYLTAAAVIGGLTLLIPWIGILGLLSGALLVFGVLAVTQVRAWCAVPGKRPSAGPRPDDNA